MCLSLMVYAIVENQLREAFAEKNETIHIQDSGPADYKDNAKPTLKKVLYFLEPNYLKAFDRRL